MNKIITKIFSSMIIAICSVFAFAGNVNAEVITNVSATMDKAMCGSALNNTVSTDSENYTAEVTKWYYYNGEGNLEEIIGDHNYDDFHFYKVQVKFTPNNEYEFNENTNYILNNKQGIVDSTEEGAVYVSFEVPIYFTIHFDSDGVADIPDQIVERWGEISDPGNLYKEGYVFYGWYDIDEPFYSFDFEWEQAYKNMTLKASFINPSNIVKDIKLNITLPKAGTSFKEEIIGNYHSGDIVQKPNIKITSSNSNIIPSVNLTKGLCDYSKNKYDCSEMFVGKVPGGQDIYFTVYLWPRDNTYKLDDNINITINGSKPVNIIHKNPESIAFSYKTKLPKLSNSISVTAKTKTVKYKKLKKKNQTVNPITVNNKKGTLTYKKLSGSKKITINKSNGKITVKKKTKKGTYKIKVKVTDSGNSYYNGSNKTITFKIKIK